MSRNSVLHYLNRKIHIQIRVNCFRIKVILTNTKPFFATANDDESVECSNLSLYIWNENHKTKPRIALLGQNDQISANLWLPRCTSSLKEYLYIHVSSSQILPSFVQICIWCKEDAKNCVEQKGHLPRSKGMLSQRL